MSWWRRRNRPKQMPQSWRRESLITWTVLQTGCCRYLWPRLWSLIRRRGNIFFSGVPFGCIATHFFPFPFSSDEESSQVFVPFVSDVRVCSDSGSGSFIQSIDLDDDQQQTSSPTSALVAASAATPQQDASSPYLLIGPPPPSLATLAAATGSGGAAGAGTEKGSRTTPPSSPHVGKERWRPKKDKKHPYSLLRQQVFFADM